MAQKRSSSFFKKLKAEHKPQKPNNIPADLAMRIIEKELDLEKTWDPKTIHELMALYTQVIEYYERNNNPKYYDFQDRMHKMLIKPQVIAALQKINCKKTDERVGVDEKDDEGVRKLGNNPGQAEEKIDKPPLAIESKPSEERRINDPMHQRKEQAELMRKALSKQLAFTLSSPTKQKNYNIIIDRHSSTSKGSAQKATEDFRSQDSTLQRRLASRRNSQLTRSMTFASYNSSDLSKVFPCDLSCLEEDQNSSTKSSLFNTDEEKSERFEKRLEEIMEKNFSERAMKIAEIKFRYESQINEISGTGEIMDMLIKQMRVNMDEEIENVRRDYNLRRQEEIKRLKEEIV